jgi:hypothetical protein
LLENKLVDVSNSGDTLLNFTTSNGYYEITEIIIEHTNADVNMCSNKPLKNAIAKADHKTCDVLFASGKISITQDNIFKYLNYACRSRYPLVVSSILRSGLVDPSHSDNQALKSAVFLGLLDVVKVLLSDTRVNPRVDNDFCIKYALNSGYMGVFEELLCKIDAIDYDEVSGIQHSDKPIAMNVNTSRLIGVLERKYDYSSYFINSYFEKENNDDEEER